MGFRAPRQRLEVTGYVAEADMATVLSKIGAAATDAVESEAQLPADGTPRFLVTVTVEEL